MCLTKRLPHLLALAIFACLCGNTLQAQTETGHSGSFSGGSSRSKTDSKITIVGKTSDPLPGYLTLLIKFSAVTGEFESGEWTLILTRQNNDGSSSEAGRLSGTVTGGDIRFDQQGELVSVERIQLIIRNGAGAYAKIVTGQGTFFGNAQSVRNQPPFTGTLTLAF